MASPIDHPSPPAGPLGLVGIDHVGLTVPDLEEAVRWFTEVMGATDPLRFGPISDPDGTLMHALLDVDRRAVIDQVAVLRIGHSANIELFQYRAPGQSHRFAKNSDWAGHHIAFYVTDIDAAVAYMEDQDVTKLHGPLPITTGPAAGQTVNYFKTPFNTYVEFISYPDGMAYETPGVTALWSPKANGTDSVVTSVPGLLGIDHIGITVPDVRAAASWFEKVLGSHTPLTFGPISDPDGTLMHDLVDVDPGAIIDEIRMSGAGHGPNVELFQYQAPDQEHVFARNSDYAAHHIAFHVRDIDRAAAHLKSQGVDMLLGPFPITDGPAAGQSINYFKTPFGTFLELISYPDGMAYARTAQTRLWDPRDNRPQHG